uniref:Uncharacterized protein n=1 Tax=Chenopodium quinoa TaxID=63459 RepID=A0A803M744_CHEQI
MTNLTLQEYLNKIMNHDQDELEAQGGFLRPPVFLPITIHLKLCPERNIITQTKPVVTFPEYMINLTSFNAQGAPRRMARHYTTNGERNSPQPGGCLTPYSQPKDGISGEPLLSDSGASTLAHRCEPHQQATCYSVKVVDQPNEQGVLSHDSAMGATILTRPSARSSGRKKGVVDYR